MMYHGLFLPLPPWDLVDLILTRVFVIVPRAPLRLVIFLTFICAAIIYTSVNISCNFIVICVCAAVCGYFMRFKIILAL